VNSEKYKKILSKTLLSGVTYDGDIEKIDYFQLLCAAGDNIHNIDINQVCMFKCQYKNKECILGLVAIPIYRQKQPKYMSDRIIDVIKDIEESFDKIEYMHNQEVEIEKFSYLTFVVCGE